MSSAVFSSECQAHALFFPRLLGTPSASDAFGLWLLLLIGIQPILLAPPILVAHTSSRPRSRSASRRTCRRCVGWFDRATVSFFITSLFLGLHVCMMAFAVLAVESQRYCATTDMLSARSYIALLILTVILSGTMTATAGLAVANTLYASLHPLESETTRWPFYGAFKVWFTILMFPVTVVAMIARYYRKKHRTKCRQRDEIQMARAEGTADSIATVQTSTEKQTPRPPPALLPRRHESGSLRHLETAARNPHPTQASSSIDDLDTFADTGIPILRE